IAGLISHSFISGACRIIGGSNQIAEQLVKSIENQGGAVFTNKEVIKISRSAGNFILTTSGNELFEGSKLISAIHPAITLAMFPDSMIRPAFQKRISGLLNTPSAFILYIGAKPDSFPYLNYNIYGHVNQNVWLDGETTGSQWPSMYMLSTPCHKPDQKFAKTITIITYMHPGEVNAWKCTTSGNRGKEYQTFKKEKTQKLLTLVGKKFPGLEGSIDWMDAATPLTYHDYTGTPDGALYGIRKDYTDPLMTTIFPKTKIPGFFFTGQNTNLHGVLGVTIGAVLTCGEILGLPYLLKKIKHGS
ncbi:MAG: NAD(P)/FAD-dependent oxidoreductase, partial [Bacteroidales bacterium]|nr:NAD(P)/FAD-dependent oxidoreductase [Bacteroidales bacterium]